MSSRLRMVREGGLDILVPEEPGGKLSARMPAFYNPRMTASRDISMLCGAAYAKTQKRGITVCDLLSATGIRGLRYLRIGSVCRLYMNDIGKTSFDLMYRNLCLNYPVTATDRKNGLVECRVDERQVSINNTEALLFLAQHKHAFHLLDLDPFGSPADFVQPCIKSMRHGSMFCATATDTAPLCGTYPRTCLRRYGSLPYRTEYKHEVGLRILVAFVARRAASMEVGITPLFSHATAHYYRIYVQVRGSRRAADKALDRIGWGLHCRICGSRHSIAGFVHPAQECCGKPMTVIGPLWVGPLKDDAFVKSMAEANIADYGVGNQAMKIVEAVSGELDIFSFFDVHALSRMIGSAAPRTSDMIRSLREKGFLASPTHVIGTGFKTNAPVSDVRRSVIELVEA